MINFIHLGAIILAGIVVAIADALIKKVSFSGDFLLALKNPWMIAILLLYIVQVIFFIYVFINKWQLGIVGNIQMVFYTITVISLGVIIFNENFRLVQIIGIIIGLIGVILMNWR